MSLVLALFCLVQDETGLEALASMRRAACSCFACALAAVKKTSVARAGFVASRESNNDRKCNEAQ